MGKTRDRLKTEEQKEKEQKQTELLAIKQKRDGEAIRRTFATDDGRRCLRLLMERCKYQSPITAVVNGSVETENMIHNAALQGLYLWLRKHIDDETLALVEIKGFDEKDNK